jgi:hypothetical protein
MNTRNYGGLENCRFNAQITGVRAHIQHLRGYARQNLTGNNPNVDPRWNLTSHIRGTMQNLDELCVRWFPHNSREYKRQITVILENMYNYSNNYR